MSIRLVNGRWLVSAGFPATADDCCCDTQCAGDATCPAGFPYCCDGVCQADPCGEGECSDCEDPCVCVVLNGNNFCENPNVSQDDCGGVFQNCVQESWFYLSSTRQYVYQRIEWGAQDENFFTPAVVYDVALTLEEPLQCEDGRWTSPSLFLGTSLRESLAEEPFIKDRAWNYSPTIIAGSDGCPASIANGEYVDDETVLNISSLDPIVPDITFLPCPPLPPEEEMEPFALSAGPGTELKALLKTLGITASPTCSCNKRAKVMDEKGCDWCEEHIDEIDGWLAEEARKRGLPYLSIAGRALIRLAVRRARKKDNS